MEIVVDDKPVTLKFRSLNLIPGQLLLNDDCTTIISGSAMTLVTLKWALHPDSHKVVMGLPGSAWDPIIVQMSKVGESPEPGKSPASSSSSKSTARRSRRT